MNTFPTLNSVARLPNRILIRPLMRSAEANRSGLVMLAVLVSVYALLRFWNASTQCLWVDEVYSVQFGRQSWSMLIDQVADDIVHPPLFYMAMHFWIAAGGESVTWLRLFPILWSLAALAPFFGICRQLEIRSSTRNTALFLIAVNSYLVYYSQEVRMYSMLLCVSLCSLYLFLRFIQPARPQRWITLSLFAVNLLLVYTHYYGCLFVATEFLYVLLFRRTKLASFFVSCAVVGICYLPWAMLIRDAVAAHRGLDSNLAWNARPGVLQIARLYAGMNGALDFRGSGNGSFVLWNLPIVLLNLPLLYWGWKAWKGEVYSRSHSATTFWLLALLATLPVAGAFLLSHMLSQSIWGDRHLIIIAVPYLLLLVQGIYHLAPPLRTVWLGAAIAWAVTTSVLDANSRTRWDDFTQAMIQTEQSSEPVTIYSTDKHLSWHLRYYLPRFNETRFVVRDVQDFSGIRDGHCWLLFLNRFSNAEEPVLKDIQERGYRVGELIHAGAMKNRVTLVPISVK
ncbi:MAG TPA: glycosyltransferase family 39 protein [Planctomycetota bacterium]|nr:glycosyltransferase family 39 protein [Planctomycetota bacterium]